MDQEISLNPPALSEHPALDRLAQATREYQAATDRTRQQLTLRNTAILEVSRLGVPRSEVARLSGLTSGRVQQLIDAAGESGVTGQEWNSELRHLVSLAVAKTKEPSIGIGIRRESVLGPHLGQGFGGQWPLEASVDRNRDAVLQALRHIMEAVEAGELDHLLTVD